MLQARRTTIFKERYSFSLIWLDQAGLNRRPHPYQGCALPAELWSINLSKRCGGRCWDRTIILSNSPAHTVFKSIRPFREGFQQCARFCTFPLCQPTPQRSWRKRWDSNPRTIVRWLSAFEAVTFVRSATLPEIYGGWGRGRTATPRRHRFTVC